MRLKQLFIECTGCNFERIPFVRKYPILTNGTIVRVLNLADEKINPDAFVTTKQYKLLENLIDGWNSAGKQKNETQYPFYSYRIVVEE